MMLRLQRCLKRLLLSFGCTFLIWQINSRQTIRNLDRFGPIDNDTAIIAIQVHKRKQFLRHLIHSLSLAKGIEKTLLIFSHDHWDPKINQLVESISFAKNMQIFYPYSIQLYPDEFPGNSTNDCPGNATVKEAKALQCANKDWPDRHGHFREARVAQLKHHWWWKINRIFDQMDATKHHWGLVLFLEEDHYVTEDFLYALKMLNKERLSSHRDADMICLGTNPKFPTKSKIEFHIWSKGSRYTEGTLKVDKIPFLHNHIGTAFTRELWLQIKSCSFHFCTFDDYNYDWSLFKVAHTCLQKKLQVLLVKEERVLHVGLCGFHKSGKHCNISEIISKVGKVLQKASKNLFPQKIKVTASNARANDEIVPKGFGGWSDPRDQLLCKMMSQPFIDYIDVRARLNIVQSLTR